MQWIKKTVAGLIKTYGTRDVKEILKCLDVNIIEKESAYSDLDAWMYKDFLGKYHIFLSSDLDENMNKFILCHELGHILLHEVPCDFYHSSNLNKGKLAREANYFALLLLLDLESYDQCYLENLSIDQLSSFFGIPMEILQLYHGSLMFS